MPPVLCLTATARPDVTEEIAKPTFNEEIGIEREGLRRRRAAHQLGIRGGCRRAVVPSSLTDHPPDSRRPIYHGDGQGGAIVYCATRQQTQGGRGVSCRQKGHGG